ncbi:hypothetical protein ACV1EC_03145 [Aeromonas hydrophila]
MKKIIILGARWAVTVAKKAITRLAVELLVTAILAVGAKMLLALTIPGIGGI